MKDFWNQRYKEEGYAYGDRPNDFLSQEVPRLKKGGKILCLAEGEGRNALFLARQGFQVTAVDFSEVGMNKLRQKAEVEKLPIEVITADLADFDMGENKWDGIISIFAHLPIPVRVLVHDKIQKALKPDGVLILEAYHPKQMGYNTGGPKDVTMLMDLNLLHEELPLLKPLFEAELEREIHEGKYHNGQSFVVQYTGQLTKGNL